MTTRLPLASSCFQNISRVILLDLRSERVEFRSAAQRDLPGVVFLAPDLLDDLEALAESLLHESLHHKMFDAWTLFPPLLGEAGEVRPPWKQEPPPAPVVTWPLDRAMGAAHVYSHLVAYARAGWGDQARAPDRLLCSKAGERAEYLLSSSLETPGLSPAGERFCRWLHAAIQLRSQENP